MSQAQTPGNANMLEMYGGREARRRYAARKTVSQETEIDGNEVVQAEQIQKGDGCIQ